MENYIQIFSGDTVYAEAFFRGLKNILIFVVASVPLLVIVSLILALIVEHLPAKIKGIYRTIYFMSYAVSVTAVSAVFLWLFNGNGGYINNVLVHMGIIDAPISWLEAQPFAWIVLVIATVWWTVGYNMMLFINGLNSIDSALFEAVAVDGGGFFSRLRYIILPGIKHVMTYVVLMTIIASFNMYGQSALITKGGPLNSTKSLIMEINDVIFTNNNLGEGSAMAILMGVVVMLFAMCQNWLSREKKEIKRGEWIMKVRKRIRRLILVIAATLIAYLFLVPLLFMVFTSFKGLSESISSSELLPKMWTLENYISILENTTTSPIMRWLANTIVVTVTGTVLVVAVDCFAAYALARLDLPFKKKVIVFLIWVMTIPGIVTTFPAFYLFRELDLINSFIPLIVPYSANATGVYLIYNFLVISR